MVEDLERLDMLTEVDRRARKRHRCVECGRWIETGETYRFETGVYEGHVSRFKTCAHCLVARKWLSEECGGWPFLGVFEDIGEHVQEYGGDPRWMWLARIYVSMRRDWRCVRSDRLMPLPKPPPPAPWIVPKYHPAAERYL